ncbi:prepilin-type N-terminal cleavage/methylation domain-containing protein [Methylocaldum sp. BRCS4]|jgi:type IV fimbrial biogenesis protein FimT|nr:prepilin-type N-terminal cleavage/methylation domain-containing protein [Methylocaldum sp. BRCS4]
MQRKSAAITIGMKTDHENGFTLIELMVAVAVLAVTLTIGVPSFRETILNNRQTTQINELVADVGLARSEAIKRGIPVTLCKRNTSGNNCDSSAAWADGWIIFSDRNRNGVLDGDDNLLQVKPPLASGTTLTFSGGRVTFDARGFSAGFNGTFIFCDSRGSSKAKGRVLSNTGRLREPTDSLSCN